MGRAIFRITETSFTDEEFTAHQLRYRRMMIDFLTGNGPNVFNIFLEASIKAIVLFSILFLNIYLYYFIYNFSFNENFLLVFFFFGFFAVVYNYAYFNILSGLDSLSLELYIQFYRLITIAKSQLLNLKLSLKEFSTINRGLFLTYRNFVCVYLETINTLESLSESFYLAMLNSLIRRLNELQFDFVKEHIKSNLEHGAKAIMDSAVKQNKNLAPSPFPKKVLKFSDRRKLFNSNNKQASSGLSKPFFSFFN